MEEEEREGNQEASERSGGEKGAWERAAGGD